MYGNPQVRIRSITCICLVVGHSTKFDNNVTITAANADCHSQNVVNMDDVRCIIKNLVRGMGNKIYFSEYTIAMLSTETTELNKDGDFLSNYDVYDVRDCLADIKTI